MSYDQGYRQVPAGYARQPWPPDHYADDFDSYQPRQYSGGQWPYAGAGQQPPPGWDTPGWAGPTFDANGYRNDGYRDDGYGSDAYGSDASYGGADYAGYRDDAYDGAGYADGYGDSQYGSSGYTDEYGADGYGGGRHVAAPSRARRLPRLGGVITGAVMGFLAAATAIGVATLAAAFFRPQASPIIAVGEAFIDRTPPALKNFAVQKFGENDKTMLLLGMYVTIALLAMAIGVLARKRVSIGVIGVAVFGLFGSFVAYTRPASKPSDVIPSIIGGIAGVIALLWLARAAEASYDK